MIKFSQTGIIHASVSDVFAVLADPSKIPLWRKDVPGISAISGPTKVGSTFVEEVHFMGTKLLQMEILEFEPNQRLVIRGIHGMPLLPTQTFLLAPHAEGCSLSLSVEMRVSGLWMLIAPLLPMMLKKIWKQYFLDLEALLRNSH